MMNRNVARTKVVISRNSTSEIDGRRRENIGRKEEKGGISFVFLFAIVFFFPPKRNAFRRMDSRFVKIESVSNLNLFFIS